MAIYREHVLPHIMNKAMQRGATNAARERVCGDLAGQVVEIGFGTGLNARYYSEAITKVLAIEPSKVCMRLAKPRITASSTPVEYAGLDGQRLDLPSDQFDAVLSTWTLCTIPDVDAALAEVFRVLKPGSAFHFVEHGHSPDDNVARWQHRLEPLNKRLLGGCHITRRIADHIAGAGFTIEQLDNYYAKGDPKVLGYTFEGRALKR